MPRASPSFSRPASTPPGFGDFSRRVGADAADRRRVHAARPDLVHRDADASLDSTPLPARGTAGHFEVEPSIEIRTFSRNSASPIHHRASRSCWCRRVIACCADLPTDPALRTEWLQILEAAVTQVFLLQAGSPAEGKTIRELDLRARTGATIVALTRSGQPFPAPQPEFRLEAGDVLVLVGRHKQLDEARRMLEAPPEYEASPAATVT